VIKGRIAYMPVEQVTGKEVDRRTDVYAVGCLLWEAVAGSRLWGTMTDPQIVRNVLKGAIPPLSSRVEADPELERIVSKATAHLPVDRYQTADELRLDLERFLRELPVVTSRDIGELLSNICREARSEQKRELAAAIANAERELTSQGIDVDGSSQMRITIEGADGGQTPGASSRRQRIMRSMSPTPGPFLLAPSPEVTQASRSASFTGTIRPRRTWMWVGIGVAALLAVVAWAPSLLRAPISADTGGAGHPTAAAASLTTPPPVAPSATDAAEQEAAPAPSASSSTKTHRVRAHGVAPPVARPAAASPRGAARPGCDPPYFFSAGIKTYKPECI
jgi:serine/threonine-protein kinase